MKEKGLRFNDGKLRYDLVTPYALEKMTEVMTMGAKKYAERNWEKGMEWSKVLASMKRHIAAFEMGEDFDQESNLLHMAHVMCNAHFLTEYYRIYPQGDDRPLKYFNAPKIGLDIDEVLCDWLGGWIKKFGYNTRPKNWNFSYHLGREFNSLKKVELDKFYLSLDSKIKELPFEPHCYITSRSVPTELTEKWIQKNNFPTAKVYSVGLGASKVQVAKESGVEIFVDDNFKNFVELNNAGIFTYLFDAPHNQKYNVGHRRIKSLNEII